MKKSSKLVTALAVAGLAFASGSAFTGTGLDTTAEATQFIGGTVSQSVTGATLAGISYGFSDTESKTSVNSISLTFTGTADGLAVTATPTGGTGGTFTCGDVLANASECTFVPTAGETGYTGLTSLDVAVSEATV